MHIITGNKLKEQEKDRVKDDKAKKERRSELETESVHLSFLFHYQFDKR